MLTIIIPVNVYILGGSLLAAAFIGFVFRSQQIKKLKKRVAELEKEVLSNHADILEFQKEKALLEQKLKDNPSSPVIPITSVSTDETKSDSRKKIEKH